MDRKQKYLSNPHITITPELQSRLGITNQELKKRDKKLEKSGPAIELPATELPVRQEVVVRKKASEDVDITTETD